VKNGTYRITYKPRGKRSLREFLEIRGRFRHLLRKENNTIVGQLEKEIESREKALIARAGEIEKEERFKLTTKHAGSSNIFLTDHVQQLLLFARN